MFSNDEELKDWESGEEKPPKRLERKWAEEEFFDPETVLCRSCQQPISRDALTCIFCGSSVFSPKSKSGWWANLKRWLGRPGS